MKKKAKEKEREMAWQVFNLLRGFYLQLGINKSVLSGGNLPSRLVHYILNAIPYQAVKLVNRS